MEFVVVPQEVPTTLCGKASEELGLIQHAVHSTVASKERSNYDHLYRPAQPYHDIFEVLGKLKGVQYHLKLTAMPKEL